MENVSDVLSKVNELSVKVDSLKDMFNALQQNVYFNITTLLTVMAVVLAASGWAMSILARSLVDKSVQSKLIQMKQELKSEVTREIIKITRVAQASIDSSEFRTQVIFPNQYSSPPTVLIQPHGVFDVSVDEVTETGFWLIKTPSSKLDPSFRITVSYVVIGNLVDI